MIKRIFDLVFGFLALLLFLPLMLVIGAIIFVSIGWPVFFIQERPGKGGELFKLIKFRTMSLEKDSSGTLLSDADRTSQFGKFLRSISVDELPELINVIKGDMSFVGPRPLLVEYLPLYDDKQKRRHDVKPGITGWAQINGRNDICWDRKISLDLWYVDNRSFFLDMKILMLTPKKVLTREGILPTDKSETKKFTGKN